MQYDKTQSQTISKRNLVNVWLDITSSAHPQPVYEGTTTDYCKDQAVFDEGAVPSLSG